MAIAKAEKKVLEAAVQHLSLIEKCLETASSTLKAYMKGDLTETERLAHEVDRYEREADHVRRDIFEWLSEGAFLPILRGDLHELISDIDQIADICEDMADTLAREHPLLPVFTHGSLAEILDDTGHCFADLKAALLIFMHDVQPGMDEVKERVHRVSVLEHKIDEAERTLTRQIFDADQELAEKLHMKQLLTRLTQISNQCEDVSDTLIELVIKLQV